MDAATLSLALQQDSAAQTAQQLAVSRPTIYRWCKTLGIARRTYRCPDIQRLRQLAKHCTLQKEIARQTGRWKDGQQREDAALREIGVLQDAARLTDDVTKLVLDRLQMRADPLPAGSLKCTKQLIASRIVSLSCGHNDTVAVLQTGKSTPAANIRSRGFQAGRLGGA